MNGLEIAAILLQGYFFIVLGRVILSWVPLITNNPLDYSNPIVRFLIETTEPVLAPMRRFLIVGMIDLSPLALLFGLQIVAGILASNA